MTEFATARRKQNGHHIPHRAERGSLFSSSAARLDRWRELNAKAQTWAAEARSGKRGGGRAATEAALAEVRALEDFFAFPGVRLMKSLAERISGDDALGVGRLARRISGALLSGSYRYDSSEWEGSDEDEWERAGSACRSIPVAGRTGPISRP